jgi:hypothetical protein
MRYERDEGTGRKIYVSNALARIVQHLPERQLDSSQAGEITLAGPARQV